VELGHARPTRPAHRHVKKERNPLAGHTLSRRLPKPTLYGQSSRFAWVMSSGFSHATWILYHSAPRTPFEKKTDWDGCTGPITDLAPTKRTDYLISHRSGVARMGREDRGSFAEIMAIFPSMIVPRPSLDWGVSAPGAFGAPFSSMTNECHLIAGDDRSAVDTLATDITSYSRTRRGTLAVAALL
jgi:hypothetical protein